MDLSCTGPVYVSMGTSTAYIENEFNVLGQKWMFRRFNQSRILEWTKLITFLSVVYFFIYLLYIIFYKILVFIYYVDNDLCTSEWVSVR